MRKKPGDRIYMVDGKGNYFEGVILNTANGLCSFETDITIENFKSRPYQLHIAISPTKNSGRFEWFLEKATEVGIDRITPLVCSRSEKKSINFNRLNKILVTAMKQSLKAKLPVLHEPIPFQEFINGRISERLRYVAHLSENSESVKAIYQANEDVIILIGPEGDFTDSELDQALQNNFLPIRLGNYRLRTETAGLVACQTIHFIND